ncbi:hypothetical protein [Chelativorans sp. AA-79]|uniref:hypothetical protein n=1 Tax=Chelativorans sp. AA-79 TaxID=3028735 RepID=UPI0023F979CF|nr:hypothetical protein [Chelativorans sp. AA-79]WEX07475.1 hypothetical protein PVE73_15245 [Chelativorans sp. AA-79]
MQRYSPRTVFLAGLLVTAGTSHVFALEAGAVAERLKTLLAEQQIDFTYENARLDGDDVTLTGARVNSPAGGDGFELGVLTLQDVTEEPDGSYRVGTLELDAFQHQEGDLNISMVDSRIEGLVLPEGADSDPFGGVMRYDHAEVARVDLENKDGPLASISNVYATITIPEDNSSMDIDSGAESFSLNLQSLVESGNGASALEDLGYEQISGSAVMLGRWQPSDGRLTLSRYEVVIDDAGTLSFLFDIGGYTPQFVQTISQIARQMEESKDEQNQAAQGMAMLGLLQQLTLHGATIRFVDDSLTGKLLDYQADRMGTTPDALIAQAKAIIPAQLGPYLGAETAASVADAVATFLQNPANIELSANPENPQPFAMLAAAAMASPEMLVKQIGLSVKANQ